MCIHECDKFRWDMHHAY